MITIVGCFVILICLLIAVIITSIILTGGEQYKANVPPIDERLIHTLNNNNDIQQEKKEQQKIIIIGGGTAGLYAGYTLQYLNITNYEILEASTNYGGRVQELNNFINVPIDLGAEWIHVNPIILQDLVLYNDDKVNVQNNIQFINYQPQTYGIYKPYKHKTKSRNWFRFFYKESKFYDTTWYSYLSNYIYPYIKNNLQLNTIVTAIDYSSNDTITITTINSELREEKNYTCDRIIIATPITILQQNDIAFIPNITNEKRIALNSVHMTEGLKVWIEFDEKFYPDFQIPTTLNEFEDKIYIDGVFRKPTKQNVLTLFQVGDDDNTYERIHMNNDELINDILDELDNIFNGQASKHYIKHYIQNWSKQPYIKGAYSYNTYDRSKVSEPIQNRIYFAGEYVSEESDNQATVHGAALSGREVAQQLLIDDL